MYILKGGLIGAMSCFCISSYDVSRKFVFDFYITVFLDIMF